MDASNNRMEGMLPRELVGSVLSIKQLWTILWAHRSVIVTTTLLLGALMVIIVKMLPKTYASTATLLVAFRADDPASGAEVSFSEPYFATQIEFIQSPVVLLPVVDKFKLADKQDYLSGYDGDGSPESRRLWAASQLWEKLNVRMGKGSYFIYVTAEDKNAAMAAQLANAVADGYVEEQVQRFVGPARERALRYSEQIKVLKVKVDEAQAKVTAFRQRTGMLDLSAVSEVDSSKLRDLDARLTEATARRREAELRLGRIREGDATVLASPLVQSLKTQLQGKQGQMMELRASLGPRHPQILVLQGEIEHLKTQLDREISSYSEGARADVEAARTVEEKFAAEVAQARKQALQLSANRDEASELLRELDSTTRVYQGALDAFEKVQMGSEMAVSNVSIVSRASPATTPAKRLGRQLVALALLVGAGGSAGLCLLWELTHRRVRCREDMEQDLNIPVLVELQGTG